MTILVYDLKTAPEWVQIWNAVNVFLLSYRLSKLWDYNFGDHPLFSCFYAYYRTVFYS